MRVAIEALLWLSLVLEIKNAFLALIMAGLTMMRVLLWELLQHMNLVILINHAMD